MSFKIEIKSGVKSGYPYDSITTFYDKNDSIEAQYFYYNGMINWLISYGFINGSLNDMRKSKAHKVNKPFFNLKQGWFNIYQ